MKKEDKEKELFIRIANATVKERRTHLIVAVLVLSLGGILFWKGYPNNAALIIIALILFLTGLKLLYDKFNEPVGFQSPLLILLSYKQKNIVWVYSIIKENMPFGVKLLGSGRIMFRTLDKKEFSISVSENEILLLSKELESHLPQATFGYSSEKDNLYEINPYLLLDSDGKE